MTCIDTLNYPFLPQYLDIAVPVDATAHSLTKFFLRQSQLFQDLALSGQVPTARRMRPLGADDDFAVMLKPGQQVMGVARLERVLPRYGVEVPDSYAHASKINSDKISHVSARPAPRRSRFSFSSQYNSAMVFRASCTALIGSAP